MEKVNAFGRTIQLYLVDDNPAGLIVASIFGWTGSLLVSTQSTFGDLIRRSELDRTGIYIFYGPDPEDALKMRAYIGEADNIRERISKSADEREFWETVVVITTADDTLTKAHGRYLEARLIQIAKEANRVVLANTQMPDSEKRRLPEADRANMEAFISTLAIILPVVGLDLLKQRPVSINNNAVTLNNAEKYSRATETRFILKHMSGVKAFAIDEDGEFVVQEGSEALKDKNYSKNSYGRLKNELIADGTLKVTDDGKLYRFTKPYPFKSPSAAGSIILDRNTNGRRRWRVEGSDRVTYHEWQTGQVLPDSANED